MKNQTYPGGHCAIRCLLALLVGVSSVVAAHSQSAFKVLAVRGKVSVGNKVVVLGQQLKTSDKITVPSGGYVGLAHANGRTLEIRKSGSYSVAELDKAASKKTRSATGKFAAYVFTELTEVQEPVSFTSERRTNMRTAGSVDRAAGDDVHVWDSVLAVVGAPGELQALAGIQSTAIENGNELSVIMPRHTRLLADSVMLLWHRSPGSVRYQIQISNASNEVVWKKELADTAVAISLKAVGIQPGTPYYWQVSTIGGSAKKSGEYALYQLTGNDLENARNIIDELTADVGADEDAIGKIILATAFEDMGLMYDAHRAYSDAVLLAPDVQNYKRLYAEFLLRRSLSVDAFLAYR